MKEIELTQGKVAQVDDEDFEYLSQFKWCTHRCHKSYYAVRNSKKEEGAKRTIQMHNVIMRIYDLREIDHIDNNGLNNQKYNLRETTSSQNNANRIKHKGKSIYKGVHFIGKCIISRISVNKKEIYLGTSNTEKDAAFKYDEAAKKYFGEFANLNFK